jgi:outer membrane protein OmpA-like peptidoglycan-associated protein
MKTFLFTCLSALLLSGLLHPCYAQDDETRWASSVIDVSSSYSQGLLFKEELRYNKYPAQQVLGNPDVLPGNQGDSPLAWVPQKPDRQEFIKVAFEQPLKIQQIAIAESRNPGAISEIYTYDTEGNEYLAADLQPATVDAAARMYNVFIDPTPYEVAAVKVVMEGALVPGYNAIDAIAISSSPVPVDASINVAEGINPALALREMEFNNSGLITVKPVIAPDGQTLFFSRRSPKNIGGETDPEDIWYSERNNVTGTWSEPRNAGRPLNNKGSNFVSSVVMDDEKQYTLLLGNAYLEDGKMQSGVSISDKSGNSWSYPEALQIENYYNYAMSANYFMSAEKRYLLMSVQRDDSRGERDLYVSFNEGGNRWTEPVNLGDQINTPDMESSPFLANDTTLYFSSRGFSGFGAEDVFVAYRLSDSWQNWTTPVNLGPQINSEKDDTFFNIGMDNEKAFLTRGKTDDAVVFEMDMPIFKDAEPMYVVQGQVYNVKDNNPVVAEIIVKAEQTEGDFTEQTLRANQQGQYEIELPPGTYQIYARDDQFNTVDQEALSLAEADENNDMFVARDLYLIDKGENVNLKEELEVRREALASTEILFELNSADLDRRSSGKLREVALFMMDNPDAELMITGHTCDRGSRNYNERLSEQRARSVAEYLREQGVSSSRLQTQGMGETDPLVNNSSESNRRINRRVEFKVME